MAPWDAVGGGGGMLGGVDRGCVFTSAGESGIAAAFSFLLAKEREREEKKENKDQATEGRASWPAPGQGPELPLARWIPDSTYPVGAPNVLTGG